MASWLDILAQNHSDSQGRFNPFSLIRGFTSQGRSEIDQQQQAAELARQNQIAAGQGALDARSGLASGTLNAQTQNPTSPEAIDVLQALQNIAASRAGIAQTEMNTRIGGANLETATQMRPHIVEGARLGNVQAQDTISENRETRPARTSLINTQADRAVRQEIEDSQNVGLRRNVLQNEANAPLNQLTRDALQNMALQYTPEMRDAIARIYGPYVPNLVQSTSGAGMPSGDGAAQALMDAVNNVAQGQQFQSSGGGGLPSLPSINLGGVATGGNPPIPIEGTTGMVNALPTAADVMRFMQRQPFGQIPMAIGAELNKQFQDPSAERANQAVRGLPGVNLPASLGQNVRENSVRANPPQLRSGYGSMAVMPQLPAMPKSESTGGGGYAPALQINPAVLELIKQAIQQGTGGAAFRPAQ